MPRIRPYARTDWDSFLALNTETGIASLRHAPEATREAFRARWPTRVRERYAWGEEGPTLKGAALFVLEDDGGGYAGHLLLTQDEDPATGVARLRVDSVAIVGKHRSRGWGRLLMERAVEEARSRGLASIALDVDADNVVARKLYEEMGFATMTLAMVKNL